MRNVNRNHFFVAIGNSISTVIKNLGFIIIIIMVLVKKNIHINIYLMLMGIFIFLSITVLYEILAWYKNTYEIKENIITVNKGVFEKKTKEIPFSKIQTINICEELKYRIFSLVLLKVDTGNSSLEETEISFVIKKSEAEKFKYTISQFKNKDDNEKSQERVNLEEIDKSNIKEIKVSNRELLLLSLTSGNVLAGMFFIFAVYNFVNKYLKKFSSEFTEEIKNSIKGIHIEEMPITKIVCMIVLILMIYLVFSLIVSIISNFIKFYDFSIERHKKDLIIKYGILNKKNYVMPVEKISALYVKQNIIKQLLGLQELHIESIGYGNENGETSMLYPITNELKKQEIIKELLPEFQFSENIIKSPRRALRRFIISNLICPIIICCILTLKFKYGYFSVFGLLIFVLKGYLEYINSGIGINSKLICLSNNSFHKTITIIPRNKIQSVVIKTNYFQRRNQIFDFTAYIQGNDFGKEIRVKNIISELKNELNLI